MTQKQLKELRNQLEDGRRKLAELTTRRDEQVQRGGPEVNTFVFTAIDAIERRLLKLEGLLKARRASSPLM